jgi:hypothetical protein
MNQLRVALMVCGFAWCFSAFAQDASHAALPEWRMAIDEVMAEPPGQAGPRDIQRLEEGLRFAVPYFSALDAAGYDANREWLRRISAYLAQAGLGTRNPRVRFAVRRANQALAALRAPVNIPQPAAPDIETAAKQEKPAPFEPRAPVVENVTEADAALVRELRSHYESAAAEAAGAWQAAGSLQANLFARRMALNPQMAASAERVQLYLETAADALRGHDWEDARDNIDRAEYETRKLLKSMGR